MSTALAIAGVSAVLRDLLNDGLVNHNVSGVVGSTVIVTTLPPDRIQTGEGTEATQLNLFLRRVTPNIGYRNEGLPQRDVSGNRLTNPPLALNLHYLVTAYGSANLHAEILLGYAMQLLHDHPVIGRDAIRTALQPSPALGNALPPALRALADSGLDSQAEPLRITPEFLDAEELSKFWTASQARYRPCAAYQVSVVLIQGTQATSVAPPVLSAAVGVQADLLPPLPTLTSVAPAGGQPAIELGTSITLGGHHLRGTARSVRLVNDGFGIDELVTAGAGDDETSLAFTIPTSRAADFPVGVYRIGARVAAGGAAPRDSNSLAVALAPRITGLPITLARDAGGRAAFTLTFHPALRKGQSASLLLGSRECAPDPFPSATTTTLAFSVDDAPVGAHLARLRIDGIDSASVDHAAKPPVFLNQRITIT